MKYAFNCMLLAVCVCGAGGCKRDNREPINPTTSREVGGSMYPISAGEIVPPPYLFSREAIAIKDYRYRQRHAAEVMPLNLSDDIRYFADVVQVDHEEGVIRLRGRVRWIRGGYLIDGYQDETSTMILDKTTLDIIYRTGEFERSSLLGGGV